MATTLSGIITSSSGNYYYTKWISPAGQSKVWQCAPGGGTYVGSIDGTTITGIGSGPIYLPVTLYSRNITIDIDLPNTFPYPVFHFPEGTRITGVTLESVNPTLGGWSTQTRSIAASPYHTVNNRTFLDYSTTLISGRYIVQLGSYMVTPQSAHKFKTATISGTTAVFTNILTTTHSGTGEEWNIISPLLVTATGVRLGVYNSHYANDFRADTVGQTSYYVDGDASGSTVVTLYPDTALSFAARFNNQYSLGSNDNTELLLANKNTCITGIHTANLNYSTGNNSLLLYVCSTQTQQDLSGKLRISVDYYNEEDTTVFKGYTWRHSNSPNTYSGSTPVYQVRANTPLYPNNFEGLIAWHTFDEVTGSFYDSSGNGHVLVPHDVTRTSGIYGKGVALSTTAPYGYVDASAIPQQTSACMVSFWFKPSIRLTGSYASYFHLIQSSGIVGTTEDITPDMTSNNAPAPYAAYSDSIYGVAYDAWKAFDHSNVDSYVSWYSSGSVYPKYLRFDFGAGNLKRVAGYGIRSRNWTDRPFPKNFELQGSLDNNTWVTLDVRTNITDPGQNVLVRFVCNRPENISYYRYFRVYITASTNGSNFVSIGELELYEESGRFGIAFNYAAIPSLQGRTGDGRLWFYTDNIGKGTNTRVWNKDQEYFIQVGFRPAASGTSDYSIWVDGEEQVGYCVASGVGSTSINTSSLIYLDSTTSGYAIIDDVCWWSRHLTSVESLKLRYPLATQAVTYNQERPHFYGFPVAQANTAVSISGAVMQSNPQLSLRTFNFYQGPPTISYSLGILVEDLGQTSSFYINDWSPPTFVSNILRYSSGWAIKNHECWGCASEDHCLADVSSQVTFYISGYATNTQAFHTTGSLTFISNIVDVVPLALVHKFPQQDFSAPVFTNRDPAPNSRKIAEEFYSATWRVTEAATTLDTNSNFVWVKRPNQGGSTNYIYDHFNAYEHDFKVTNSGYGWTMLSGSLLDACIINEGFKWKVSISGVDYYGDTFTDASRLLLYGAATSGGFISAPDASSVGTGYLELTTSKNTGLTSAPGVALTMPSGLLNWEIETKVSMYHDTTDLGFGVTPQAAGLQAMISGSYRIVGQLNNIATYRDSGMVTQVSTRTTTDPHPVWFKLTYDYYSLSSKWSEDGQTWNALTTWYLPLSYTSASGFMPIFTTWTKDNYTVSVDSWYQNNNIVDWEGWHVFDSNTTTDVAWHTNSYTNHPHWLKIDFGSNSANWKVVTQIRMRSRNASTASWRNYPKDFKFQGSHNNSTWTDLGYWTNQVDPGQNAWGLYYQLSNASAYRYYRLYTLSATTGNINACIKHLQLFEGVRELIPISVGPCVTSTVTSSRINALFDYVKVSTPTALSGSLDPLGMDNSWELISVSGASINSELSSGQTTLNTTIANQLRYTNTFYDNLLPEGSNFAVRALADDAWGFKNDYIIDTSTTMLMTCDTSSFLELINDWTIAYSGAVNIVKEEVLYNQYYCTPVYETHTTNIWQGVGAIDTTSGTLYTPVQNMQSFLSSSDWTIQFMIKPITLGGVSIPILSLKDTSGTTRLSVSISSAYISVSIDGLGTYIVSTWSYGVGSWHHVGIEQRGNWIYCFVDGHRYDNGINIGSYHIPSTDSYVVINSINAYLDLIMFSNKALWEYDFNVPNRMDSMYLIRTLSIGSFDVTMNILPDVSAPKIVPVQPVAGALSGCVASGIQFDILDDITGVDWDTLVIRINDEIVWKSGQSYCDWVGCAGRLVYEDRGAVGQEWTNCQTCAPEWIPPSGVVAQPGSGNLGVDLVAVGLPTCVDGIPGINQELYPHGTVYEHSGAWGRRFYYTYTDDVPYDSWVTVTVSGRDVYGVSTDADELEPNYFNDSYTFKIITNKNIKFDNFFLGVGERAMIDPTTTLTVDIWDTNYPDTDIDESSVLLTMYDGVDNLTCSGTTFSTYINTDGILVHRLSYDPTEDFSWRGHRDMKFTVWAKNTNEYCDVHNSETYELAYGLNIFWDHSSRPAWPANTKIPISIHGKTFDYLPAELGQGWMIWTAQLKIADFYVTLDRIWAQFKVCFRAMSYKLQYSEDVPVTVECEDYAGNKMVQTFTFRTGDKPT